MKVVAILGGLGSQMFKYAFYLQIKNSDDCYIDTMPYRLQKMWNGYELKRIFNIEAKDITERFTEEELENISEQTTNYKYTGEIMIKRLDSSRPVINIFRGYLYPQKEYKFLVLLSLGYNKIKRILKKNNDFYDTWPVLYRTSFFSIYYDEFNHTSNQYIGGRAYQKTLQNVFRFPDFTDEMNIQTAKEMGKTESVSMHIRRSDHLYDNKQLFDNHYFARAVQYIKRKVSYPVFYLFSDELSWCNEHLSELGLKSNDKVILVDWNQNTESYRDMQLMTYCKHNILAISSFSWWGYYLSKHENKIVCAPEGYWSEVPIHF